MLKCYFLNSFNISVASVCLVDIQFLVAMSLGYFPANYQQNPGVNWHKWDMVFPVDIGFPFSSGNVIRAAVDAEIFDDSIKIM